MTRISQKPLSRFVATAATVGAALAVSPAQAYTIFFGEDLGQGEDVRLSATPNADNARNNFFSNLVGVGTEDFEDFAPGTATPLSLIFPGAEMATLTGNGTVDNVPSGTNGDGRYPISGNQYLEIGSNFTVDFSQEIAAFGFYGTDIGDFNGQLTLTLTNGTSQTLNVGNTVNAPGGSALYYGVIAENEAEAFTSVEFGNTAAGTDVFGFDNLTIGSIEQVEPMQPTTVPEPASVAALLSVGVLSASSKLKRHQKEA